MDRELFISDMKEKKVGLGEDSNPIFYADDKDNVIFIGVFDGMGGAGSTECVSAFSENGVHKTMAYVGSRIVRNAIDMAIRENPALVTSSDLATELKNIINRRYASEKEKYQSKTKAGIRSRLIKEYPTTLAITRITRTASEYLIDSLWAGDSRNYIWSKDGVFQISTDDLKGNLDPMQNLHEDAPMSNCIQADSEFKINHNHIEIPVNEKFVVVSATDGCFGYYPSPMDFELALYDALKSAKGIKEFESSLTNRFLKITGDDFSYAVAPIGFSSYKEIKSYFKSSNKIVKEYYEKQRNLKSKIKKTEKKLNRLKSNLENSRILSWQKYKRNYLKYTESDEGR